jgi:hypothetical protein
MSGSQLPLFQRKTYKGIIPTIPLEIQAPGANKTVLETLPAYFTYLQNGGFSKYTPDDFTGDVKKFGVYCKGVIAPFPKMHGSKAPFPEF